MDTHNEEKQGEHITHTIGAVVIESALLRLVSELDDEEEKKLSTITDNVEDPDELIKNLFEAFPTFEQILNEEGESFRKDTEVVMQKVAELEEGN